MQLSLLCLYTRIKTSIYKWGGGFILIETILHMSIQADFLKNVSIIYVVLLSFTLCCGICETMIKNNQYDTLETIMKLDRNSFHAIFTDST